MMEKVIKEKVTKEKVFKGIGIAIVLVIVGCGIFYGLIWALLALWNSTIPQIFSGVNELDFGLAFRLLLLLIVFGGFFGSGHNVSKKIANKPEPASKGIRIGFGNTTPTEKK